MLINRDRVFSLLINDGFDVAPFNPVNGSRDYVRASLIDGIYESIIIDSQGKNDEAVYASVGIALTRSVKYKVLGDTELIVELAENSERGWTIITDGDKAKEWEVRLSQVAPRKARLFAESKGLQLLESTSRLLKNTSCKPLSWR